MMGVLVPLGAWRIGLDLAPDKAERLVALFASLPDAELGALAHALRSEAERTRAGRALAGLLAAEQHERRLRNRIFSPLLAQTRRADAGLPGPLPPGLLHRLWRTLRRDAEEETRGALAAMDDRTDPARARQTADAITALAAERLRGGGPWAELRETLEAQREGAVEALAARLALAPLARACAPRLDAWLRTASPEHASAIRLAYRDAAAVGEDAPPVLLQMLGAGLDPPCQMLRLVAAVMDRPKDTFLAVSELGALAEAVLDDVDARIQTLRAFDAAMGAGEGERAAEAVCGAVRALAEIDRSIDVQPSGPWAARLAAARRNLARGVEARLRLADPTLARALPIAPARPGVRLRSGPKLDEPPDEPACTKAQALLAFHAGVRAAAEGGGFATVRAKIAEALDLRLSLYADELLQLAHDAEPQEAQAARARLPFVADALARVRDAKAAEVLRRRAAAA